MPFIFAIKVIPQSGKQALALDKQGSLVCYLLSAPEQGKANKELIKLVAKALKIPQADVEISAGKTSRNKLLRVPLELTQKSLLIKLGLEKQLSFIE